MNSKIPTYSIGTDKTQLIAMVHVPTSLALQNNGYNKLLKTPTYSTGDLEVINNIRLELHKLHETVMKEYKIPYLKDCKSAVFLLKEKETNAMVEQILTLPFVKALIDRAIKETDIYTRHGISMICIENTGAPYFMGSDVPFEELLILHAIALEIRSKFPDMPMGIQVLSSNELESLPIAIAAKAYFIRSEATIFSGLRPEGKTENSGTLAKLFYLRNFFQTFLGVEDPIDRLYPKVWSDLQKKHTVFEPQLHDLTVWLDNMLFMKLEGVILTGLLRERMYQKKI